MRSMVSVRASTDHQPVELAAATSQNGSFRRWAWTLPLVAWRVVSHIVRLGHTERMDVPILEGDARAAVKHRGGHLQIIASAGSGKTEVVSQRVARLLSDGEDPRGIVAFTFTERAAEELRQRIELRVEQALGRGVLDRIGGLFVGASGFKSCGLYWSSARVEFNDEFGGWWDTLTVEQPPRTE